MTVEDANVVANRIRAMGHSIVFEKRQETTRVFDREHADLITAFEVDAGEILRRMTLITALSDKFAPGPFLESMSLLSRALESVISAFHLLRQRAYVEAGVLLRHSIELIAVSVQISNDPKAFALYSQSPGRSFQAPKAISAAKGFIPNIGEVFGTLSTLIVHPNAEIHGAVVTNLGSLELQIGTRSGSSPRDRVSLVLLLVVSAMIMCGIEASLTESAAQSVHVPGRPDIRFPGARRLVDERLSMMQQLVDESMQNDGKA